MIKKFNSPIISLTINIPGLNKITKDAKCILDASIKEILKSGLDIVEIKTYETASGYEAQISIKEDAIKIKNQAIYIENNHPLGRFMDIDVIDKDAVIISRKNMLIPVRKCYLCENDAKICARSKKHSLDELLSFIHQKVLEYEKD